MELNSDGKIQLEETINESIINGDASNTTANVSDSTLDDSKNITQNSDKLDTSGVESIVDQQPTAAVLSIDDPESGEIFKNHLICNNINNNHIPNNSAPGVVVAAATATTPADNIEPMQIALTKSTVASSINGDKNTATITNTVNGTANDKTNEANGDVVNNDNDTTTKRLSNNSNTDAANAVGLLLNPHLQITRLVRKIQNCEISIFFIRKSVGKNRLSYLVSKWLKIVFYEPIFEFRSGAFYNFKFLDHSNTHTREHKQ